MQGGRTAEGDDGSLGPFILQGGFSSYRNRLQQECKSGGRNEIPLSTYVRSRKEGDPQQASDLNKTKISNDKVTTLKILLSRDWCFSALFQDSVKKNVLYGRNTRANEWNWKGVSLAQVWYKEMLPNISNIQSQYSTLSPTQIEEISCFYFFLHWRAFMQLNISKTKSANSFIKLWWSSQLKLCRGRGWGKEC